LKVCTTISAQSVETNIFHKRIGNIPGESLFGISSRGGEDLGCWRKLVESWAVDRVRPGEGLLRQF